MTLETVDNNFKYKKLSDEEKLKRGILGQLVGVIADFKHPTRNGRLYTEELWDKVFNDEIMQEKLRTNMVLGELGHPDNRTETDITNAAIALDGYPKKTKDGKLIGAFNILDTPNGRILKTLCDYGCSIGISSRGEGDTITDYKGDEIVDPNTYQCECWDAVIVPSVEDARLSLVENLGRNKKVSCTEALKNQVNKAKPQERQMMLETLDRVGIDIGTKSSVASNNMTDDSMIQSVKGMVSREATLKKQIRSLKEQLSECNNREAQYVEELDKLALENDSLKARVNTLCKENNSLREGFRQRNLQKSNREINERKQQERAVVNSKALNEEVRALRSRCELAESKTDTLQEELEDVKQNNVIMKKEYNRELKEAYNEVERYKQITNTAIDELINEKASSLDVSPSLIKKRLGENYSLNDIKEVFNELEDEAYGLSSIPKATPKKKVTRVKMTEDCTSKNHIDGCHIDGDEIDSDLIGMVNLRL